MAIKKHLLIAILKNNCSRYGKKFMKKPGEEFHIR